MSTADTPRAARNSLSQTQIELFASRCGLLDGEAPLRALFQNAGSDFDPKPAAIAALMASIHAGHARTFAYALSLGHADRDDLQAAMNLAVDLNQIAFAEEIDERIRSMEESAWFEAHIAKPNPPNIKKMTRPEGSRL